MNIFITEIKVSTHHHVLHTAYLVNVSMSKEVKRGLRLIYFCKLFVHTFFIKSALPVFNIFS